MLEEMKKAREAAIETREAAHKFLKETKVAYESSGGLTHDELNELYNNKLSLYAQASDHLVAVKVADFMLNHMKRGVPSSNLAVAFEAECRAAKGVLEDLTILRYALMDISKSLNTVCMGIAEMKKSLFRGM